MGEPRLPHQGPARFLRKVLAHDDRSLRGSATVPEGSPYAEDGAVDALLAVEIAAQACAAHAGIGAEAGGSEVAGTPRGYLVGVRELEMAVTSFPVETEVEVTVELVGRAAPLETWGFLVGNGAGKIASGQLSLWGG